jgi:hypothetical protein
MVKRPSPERAATAALRRFRPLGFPPVNESDRPFADLRLRPIAMPALAPKAVGGAD